MKERMAKGKDFVRLKVDARKKEEIILSKIIVPTKIMQCTVHPPKKR